MKKIFQFFVVSLILASGFSLTACDDDDFTDTIFDVSQKPLDRAAFTFSLDTFLVKHFQEPYNMQYKYKMEDIGSNMGYDLVPCSYENSEKFAVLCEYLWYDVYKGVVGETFLKKYSPRIIHLIGSPAYNPTSGTEILGTAEGGLKITLYKGNELNVNIIDGKEGLNELFFKTMHHEFSHILNQNVNRPTDFDLISNGRYNSSSWQDTPDSVALGNGFISPYSSSMAGEDWVENIAVYIVKDDLTDQQTLSTAAYEWEEVDYPASTYDASVNSADRDTLGYMVRVATYSGDKKPETYKIQRKRIQRDDTNSAIVGQDGKWIYLDTDGVNGRDIILQKRQMVREWLQKNFNYDLDKVRLEVQRRQWVTDADGNYVVDPRTGRYINNLTYKRADGTCIMDDLMKEIRQYDSLRTK